MTQYMDLVDVHGPYAGQTRRYTKTAGENALDTGYARLPEDAGEAEAEAGTALPKDFPGAEELAAADITTVEAVPESREALEQIPGIGPKTAAKILKALEAFKAVG